MAAQFPRSAHPSIPPSDRSDADQPRVSRLTRSMRSSLGLLALLGGLLIATPAGAETDRFATLALQQSEACVSDLYAANPTQAQATCQQALTLTQAAGDRRLEAYVRGNLGTLALQQQQYEAALAQFNRTLQLAESIDDPNLQVKALIAIGTTEMHLDQLDAAVGTYQQALTIAQTQDDEAGIAVAYYNLGLVYDQLQDNRAAIDAYQQATAMARSNQDEMLESMAAQKLLASQETQEAGNRQISIR